MKFIISSCTTRADFHYKLATYCTRPSCGPGEIPANLFVADVGIEIGLVCHGAPVAYGLSEEFDLAQTVMDLIGMPIVGGIFTGKTTLPTDLA